LDPLMHVVGFDVVFETLCIQGDKCRWERCQIWDGC
jgi:hypothetical protein